MLKIRLQRHGKKGKPFFKVVVANSIDKRDGRFVELLGTYNPNTNPAQISINLDRAVYWLETGAQPSETAERILSYKGALLKKHLNGGVKKGALTAEQAEAKFESWLKEKEAKVQAKIDGLGKNASKAKSEAIAAEKETNKKRLEAQAAKLAAAQAAAAPAAEEVAEEAATQTEAPETEAAEAPEAAE